MEIDLPSLFFGATVGIFPFVLSKIITQTWKIMFRRKITHSLYVYMIWLDAIAGLIFGIITILYLKGVIPGHFGLFFASGNFPIFLIPTAIPTLLQTRSVS